MAYAVEMTRRATVLRDTPFAFTPEKITILSNYLLQGENWVTWRGSMDIAACGRQLFPNSPASKAGVIRGTMCAMALADVPHAPDYLAFVTRNTVPVDPTTTNDLVGTRYFWRSDYLVHRRPDAMTSLKMSSTRVIGGETVNSENLSGLHLADGATYFYRSGHEYDDIFPTWDWRMIPGTTAVQDTASLTWPATADLKKGSDFVGGVTDGTSACAAMDFHRDDLHAKKAWFFSGDTLVCLGADIASTGPDSVSTTLNQCLLKSPVTVQRAGTTETVRGATRNSRIPTGFNRTDSATRRWRRLLLFLSAASQTGNWKKVFDTPATPKADVSHDLFTLAITHGPRPAGATYAYAVVPARDTTPMKVLANTGKVQAVETGTGTSRCDRGRFLDAGTADLGGIACKVDAPCLLLQNASRVVVSDPTQKLKTLRLQAAGKSATVSLPQGGEAGKSVVAFELR